MEDIKTAMRNKFFKYNEEEVFGEYNDVRLVRNYCGIPEDSHINVVRDTETSWIGTYKSQFFKYDVEIPKEYCEEFGIHKAQFNNVLKSNELNAKKIINAEKQLNMNIKLMEQKEFLEKMRQEKTLDECATDCNIEKTDLVNIFKSIDNLNKDYILNRFFESSDKITWEDISLISKLNPESRYKALKIKIAGKFNGNTIKTENDFKQIIEKLHELNKQEDNEYEI